MCIFDSALYDVDAVNENGDSDDDGDGRLVR